MAADERPAVQSQSAEVLCFYEKRIILMHIMDESPSEARFISVLLIKTEAESLGMNRFS